MRKKKILLIGWDSNICLSVLYCLKSHNFDFYLLTHNPKNAARFSIYIKKVYYYDQNENIGERIINIMKDQKFDLIMPYDEIETRKIKEVSERLNAFTQCTWGTDPEMFNKGIHKLELANFLKQHNIPCPYFTTYDNKVELQEMIKTFDFPLLIKPVRSSAGRNIQKIFDLPTLDKFFENKNIDSKNFMIQPFLIGSDVTCNVICKHGEVICHTIQESPIKTGEEFNANDNLTFKEDAGVIKIVREMMKLLQWHGVACVDLRRDIRNNQAYILEINGRFWASVAPSLDKAGVNFPLILAKLSMGEPITIPTQKEATQISISEYLKQARKRKLLPLNATKFGSYLHDPIARAAQILKK